MNGYYRARFCVDTLYTGKLICKHRNRVSCSVKTARPACLPTGRLRSGFRLSGSFPNPLLGVPKPLFKTAKNIFKNPSPLLAETYTPAVIVAKGTSPFLFQNGKGVNKVDLQAFQESKRHQFDAYCKKVLRNAARDIYRRLAHQAEHEISLSDFSENGASIAAVMDEYFEEERQFEALEFSVTIKSELLAKALRLLPERQREIIMRYYFFGMNDREIGETSDTVRNTVSYQRNAALHKLYEIMEGLQNEQ